MACTDFPPRIGAALPVSGDCASSSANASAARAVRIEWETGGGECGGMAQRVEQEKAQASSRRRRSRRRRSLPALRRVDANSQISDLTDKHLHRPYFYTRWFC